MKRNEWNKIKFSVWDMQIDIDYEDNNSYPGKFYPKIPERLIRLYSEKKETILDCFCGSGTTNIEAKKLGRNSIGIDINSHAVLTTKSRLSEIISSDSHHSIIQGDNRKVLKSVEGSSIDLIITSPPYFNILKYTPTPNILDLGNVNDYKDFLENMELLLKENYRIIKPDRFCCWVVGDITTGGFKPFHFDMQKIAERVGFQIKGNIIIVDRCDEPNTLNDDFKYPPLFTQIHEYVILLTK